MSSWGESANGRLTTTDCMTHADRRTSPSMAFVKKEVLGCVASADAVHLQTVRPHGKRVARVSCLGVVSKASSMCLCTQKH